MSCRYFSTCVMVATVLVLGAVPVFSAESTTPSRPTFYKDVLPIMAENCQECHRPGGTEIAGMVAPMSFTSYREVRPWAKAISRAVSIRQMPPWDASEATAGVFKNERTLTQAEIDTIVRWVAQGAGRGSVSDFGEAKEFEDTGGWVIGKPDLIVYMDEPYFVEDDVLDVQPRINMKVTKDMLPEPRWLQAIEYKPGSDVVHHISGYATAPSIPGHEEERFSLGSIAAGEDPTMYPEGFGNLLRSGTDISMSLHYHKEAGPGTGTWDRSAVGFKFHPKGTEVKHKVSWNIIGSAGFEIPPLHSAWEVGSARIFEKDTILLSLHPHMHYRGKDMMYTAYYPDGTEEVLLDVGRYDYSWQINYIYNQPKLIPAGTRIEVTAHFDNSLERG